MNVTGSVMTSSPISRRRDSHSDQEDAFEAAPDYHLTIAQALAEAIERGLEIQDENVTDGNLVVFTYFIVIIILTIALAHLRFSRL